MTNQTLYTAIVVGGLLFVAGQYVASQPQRIQQEVEANREITVSGTGEVSVRPDIALLTLGVTTGPQRTAEQALDILATRFEAVVNAVEAQGVDEDDIKTMNLSINPRYDFENGRQNIIGYEASESIIVKVRDLDAVGDVVSSATVEGVNQVGGISFRVDDPTDVELQAQEAAIEEAEESAKRLAEALGARLGKVKSFSAQSNGGPFPFAQTARAELAVEDAALNTPPVNPGTQDVTSTVTVTYELR